MRKCPIKTCRHTIANQMFVCGYHWQILPMRLKDDINQWFGELGKGDISLPHLRHLVNQALADWQGITLEEVEEEPVTAAVSRCGCGRMTVLAAAATGQYQALEEDAKGDKVVIGCRALPAKGKAAIYTRFKDHNCVLAKYPLQNARADDERAS